MTRRHLQSTANNAPARLTRSTPAPALEARPEPVRRQRPPRCSCGPPPPRPAPAPQPESAGRSAPRRQCPPEARREEAGRRQQRGAGAVAAGWLGSAADMPVSWLPAPAAPLCGSDTGRAPAPGLPRDGARGTTAPPSWQQPPRYRAPRPSGRRAELGWRGERPLPPPWYRRYPAGGGGEGPGGVSLSPSGSAPPGRLARARRPVSP